MRNHAQSLLYTLTQVEEAVEVYHGEHYRNKRWTFPDHNFTVSIVWSPFLAKATIFEDDNVVSTIVGDDNGVSSDIIQLHLDELNTVWTQQYRNFDCIFIARGKWFLKAAVYYENNTIVGCHNCQGKNITENRHSHFENDRWNNGGYCNTTKPFREGEVDMDSLDEILRKIVLEEFEMAAAIGSENGRTLKLFEVLNLSLSRPDRHPGAYRHFQRFAFVLAWPIDYLNDLILKMLLNS
ncbi:hypothetical protein ACH5RR_000094 [Cinchona calisaya]|uniref:Trichome birefringence-like C-terminal domain-containing protein n=1 Tax=Cinchona calisaya TaxID=153742 RepID=A0ABD3B042_9GENT